VSKRNAGRRGKPRKRRGGAATGGTGGAVAIAPESAQASRPAPEARTPAATRTRGARGTRGAGGIAHRDPGGVGERPQAPWHPWPFSEILIFVGAIGTIVGATTKQPSVLFASLGSVLIGTLEFTIREHRTGYRSHASLLAAVPTALFHGAVAFGLNALGARGAVLVAAPLAVDVPLFWLLFRLLRARFDDARRERVFAMGRR
jgi:hypothetical protein